MVYWKKNLLIVWICQFLAMVGMSAIVPFLPLFIRELGVTNLKDTAWWSGLVFAGPFFISLFLAPVWGSLGDRYGRKIMTLRAIFGLAVAQIIIGFSQNITQLFIGRLLQGALSGFLPAAMALIASNTPEEKTGYALGLLQSSTAAGTVLGPLIGGVISDLFGFRFVFFSVGGLLIAISFVLLILVKEKNKATGEKKYSLRENFNLVVQNKILLISSIMITFAALGSSFVRPIFVLYVETLHLSAKNLPTVTGALYSIVGIFSTISSAWWGKRVEKIGLRKSLIIASLLTASMYAAHAFVQNPYLLIPVRTALGFGYGALLPLLFTSISNNVSNERKGGIIGVGSSFQILGNMIGPLMGGFAVGVIGLRQAFLITAFFFVVTSFLSYKFLKK